ncbi:MAG: hypothetical protein DMG78_11945 [Acidobacteria bacterium]|nr:MAG: hypothetical protein DMG78_11945 [Acidobacteriota bacterium]
MSPKNLESSLDYSDPLELIPRALTKVYSLWVSRTFPLASTGARLSIHPSVDLKRAMARRIKLGNNIVIAKDAWLNVPGSLHGETGPAIVIDDNCAIGRRSQISAKNRFPPGV